MNAETVGQFAIRSLLYEASTTQKPGLVDRRNSGAHSDMDYFTFMASGAALAKGFHLLANLGYEWSDKPLKSLLNDIRPIGLKMGKCMLQATGDINTHRGVIFSLGLVTFATSRLVSKGDIKKARAEDIFEVTSQMTEGICKNELEGLALFDSNGKKVYKRFGKTGIRGEVEAGFPTLLKGALDEVRKGSRNYADKNAFFLQILFQILKHCEDSTILYRHEFKTLEEVQLQASSFLDSGGMLQPEAMKKVLEMDQAFIGKNISPGGSADLLAVSIMIGLLEGSYTLSNCSWVSFCRNVFHFK